MVADFADLVQREPVVATYDYICDLTEFCGDAFAADVGAIATAYAPHASRAATYTCFATPDPHFHLWARAMDELFRGRSHRVFPTPRNCLDFLEQVRSGPGRAIRRPSLLVSG
ncbi:hypothetical protein [Phenylobacterium sp.]|uniref:hypothetical protein n=1 Tax=Phenylobacterium sp. TaxID=1871053 RepID=UPI002FE3A720